MASGDWLMFRLNSRKVLGLIWGLHLWFFGNDSSDVFFQCAVSFQPCPRGSQPSPALILYSLAPHTRGGGGVGGDDCGVLVAGLEPLVVEEMIGRSLWPRRFPACTSGEEERRN